jgi:hypothetical protein
MVCISTSKRETVFQHYPTTELAFDGALQQARGYLTALACAVGTGMYFDAWLAAYQLRAALDQAEQLSGEVSREYRPAALRRLGSQRLMAAPMLALAPRPGILEVRETRTLDAHAIRCAWENAERHWWHGVLQHLLCSKEHPTVISRL